MRDELVKKYLTREVRTFSQEVDNNDYPNPIVFQKYRGSEFSLDNRRSLLNEFLKVKSKTNVIVEIGVARLIKKNFSLETGWVENEDIIPFDESSTSIFLRSKSDSTIYLGIDIEDKSHLETYKPNVYTLKAKSEDFEVVSNKMKEVGINQIDFLFIDGWHSINQVLDELWYLQFMKPGGVIGFHDINYHPGPKAVFEALNPDMFETINYNTPDWGIGFAKIK
jgi:hypothetical protein